MHYLSNRTKDKMSFVLFTLINIVISFLLHYIQKPFCLNENQLLYIFSTIAQVAGALFGLTLAAYAIIDDKLKKIGDTEETSYDYANCIRLDSFHSLILISVLSILTIILSLSVLSLYRNKNMDITIFFILETIYLFLHLLTEIYAFIKNANPENITIKKETEKKSFDSEYFTSTNDDAKSFGSFITYYNLLEKHIKNLAQAQISGQTIKTYLQIMDALDILIDHKIISRKCYAKINELRLYRNSLVHSTENTKTINPILFETLQRLCELFSVIEKANDTKSYSNARNELDIYINSLLSNVDETILNFLIDHPKADIRDIAGSLNISVSTASRNVHKLITYGYVTKQSINKKTVYQPSVLLPKTNGSFSFDYSNQNGIYIIGNNEWKFSTKWSKGSNDIIHAYSDCEDIDCIARIKQSDISNISMSDLANCDYSSRCRDIAIGDIAVWKNKNGHYLLTRITAIQDDTRGYDNDLVQGTYRIFI